MPARTGYCVSATYVILHSTETFQVPARITETASRPQSQASPVPARPSFAETVVQNDHGDVTLNYVVKSGDTLSKVSRQFGTDVATLMQFNAFQVENMHQIKAGQSLVLPTTYYVVKPGDTYSKIGREFGIDHKKLMALNEATSDLIRPGQALQVPVVSTPETTKLRGELKALVQDLATAEGRLYFGEGTFTVHESGNSIHLSGPVDSGRSYEFSHDFKHVQVWDASGEEAEMVPVKDVESFRQLLVADVMTGVLHSRAHKADEQHPDLQGQFNVLSGPTVRDGKISFVVDEPLCHDAEVVYDSKTGQLTYTDSATGEPKTVSAGKSPSEVATTLANLFKLKIPLYEM